MAGGYYDAVREILVAQGYEYSSPAKGSHEKWKSPVTGKTVIVPRNLKSRHTANGICKDIGAGKRF